MRSFFKQYSVFIFLGILLILGLLIRIEGLFSNNVLFLSDTSRDLLFAKNIIFDHKLYLIGPPSGGLQGYFHGVLWYYLLAIPVLLGNGHPLSGLIFMIVGSLISVILAFFLVRKISNNATGLLAATFFAVTIFSVQTSRFTWNPYPIVWLMPVYFYFSYQYFNKKRVFPILSFLTSLFIHFEAVYGIGLIIPLIVLAVLELRRKRFKQILIGFAVFLIPIVPSLLFDMRHQFLISKNIIGSMLTGGGTITHGDSATVPFITRLLLRINDLFTYTVNALSTNIFVNVLVAVFALFGLKKVKRSFLLFSLLVLLVPFCFFLTLRYEVWSYYWIGETPYFVLLICLLIGSKFKEYLIALIILVVFLFSGYFKDLAVHKNGFSEDTATTLAVQLAVTDTIVNDVKENPFSVYVLTPPVYDYTYRYLFWWKGHTQSHNFPTIEKQRTVYVIVEKNLSDPTGDFFIKNNLHLTTNPIKIWHFPEVDVKKFKTQPNESPVDPNLFPANL